MSEKFQQSHTPNVLGIYPELKRDETIIVKCIHCKKYQTMLERKAKYCTKCLKHQEEKK